MRKRSGQVHSRESSATLQLTVSLLYLFFIFMFLFHDKAVKIHLYMSESGKIRPEISEETIDPNIKEVLYERFFYEYPYGKYCH